MNRIFILSCFIAVGLLISCGGSDDPSPGNRTSDNFDRGAMLTNWADNIIVPAYTAFNTDLTALKTSTETFVTTPTTANLTSLRSGWLKAYKSWQTVSIFEIGKAEEISFRNFMNVYPVNAADLKTALLSGNYDLTSISAQDEQGFAAMDYLINGVAANDAAIVAVYTDATNGAKYKKYIKDVIGRMATLTSQVVTDWTTGGYKTTFVNNKGKEATSSVNKLVNDYLFYYEKALRANKIGIPAGVFSSAPLNTRVEAFYKKDVSKELFLIALNSTQDFFNGKHFGKTTTGESIKSYLDFLKTKKGNEDLSVLINNQFDAAKTEAQGLQDNFITQIDNANSKMLKVYDKLQANVVHMKVDMLKAFGISVDFVDADGD